MILHLQPELVQQVEKDLLSIMAGGTEGECRYPFSQFYCSLNTHASMHEKNHEMHVFVHG